MAISQRKDGDVTILEISGPITIGQGDAAVREAIQSALTAGAQRILLDLDGVTALDSSGVGELMSAYTSIANRGGLLKLARLSPKVDSVLQVTRLSGVLDSYATEEDALVAFAQNR
ncbi:MAG: STAS domain-containing protein [Acidobacteriota bacterium]|nr:STAS domain-containing protein [Acidobacteriota bacterium]